MSGERNLDVLLRSMTPELDADVFVFCALPADYRLPVTLDPLMIFHEAEGITLILRKTQAEQAALPHQFPCRRITLTIHSALEAVGFMAVITSALAQAGISVNPVSAFYHDHLFVPQDRAEEAIGVLKGLSEG